MTTRAMWKGVIRVGRQQLAVKLHAAVEDADVHFHLLHEADGVRVEQRIVDPQSGQAVPTGDVRKGLPVGDGVFVVLQADELKALAPKPSRDIEVTTFVPDASIPAAWFERPYHLSPEGDTEDYYAFAAALGQSARQGIAHWTMRGKHYTGALRAQAEHLVLIALRDRDEVIAAPELAAPSARAHSAKELALAEQLVATLEGEFDPLAFQSGYRERVSEFVKQKASGTQPPLRAVRKRAPAPASLERALAASVKRAHGRGAKEKKSA